MESSRNNGVKSKSTFWGWTVVLLIALAAAVGHAFGRFSYGVVLPAVRDYMGITNALAGSIGAANVSAYLLGPIIVDWATSRFKLARKTRRFICS